MIKFVIAAACAIALAGCTTVPAAQCDGLRPLRPKAATVDYLAANDPALKDDLLTYNLYGEARCGWKR